MIQGLMTSKNAMLAHETALDSAANNLANVNTTAFKRSRVEFKDLFSSTLRAAGTSGAQGQQIPTGIQVGTGVQVAATTQDFSQGPIQTTANDLDVAIQGEGFLQVRMPDGSLAYTRDGSLHLNANRQVVTSGGLLLQPPLTIPPNAASISIGADGVVSVVDGNDPTLVTPVGTIMLARFTNPAGLRAKGQNLFQETAASGGPQVGVPGEDGLGTLQQGALEGSNVELVSELVGLITAQRAFESSSRVVLTSDEMWQTANDIIR